MTTRPPWLSALAVLVAAGPAMPAERMPLPPIAAVERGAYRARDRQTGRALWDVAWVLQQEAQADRLILHLQEEGTGTRESAVWTVWVDRMRVGLWGPHPALTSFRETRDAAGGPVRVEQREFDYERGSGQLVRRDGTTGDTDVRVVPLPGQAIPTELLPAILRLLPERRDRQMHVDLVTGEGRLVGIHATVVGREWVTVPAGTFRCFKVELEPTGLAGLLAAFQGAKFFMWHTVAAPHFWVKYQGPEGSLGSRQIVRELVRFETEVATAAFPRALPPAEGLAASSRQADRPDDHRSASPQGLGFLLVLAAVVFVIGVECGHVRRR